MVGTELEKCLRCICYATTFCNHLPNCVKAHITKQYWEEAGSPTLDYEKPSAESYRKCMANTNCVLNTMDSYTTGRGAQRVSERFNPKNVIYFFSMRSIAVLTSFYFGEAFLNNFSGATSLRKFFVSCHS